MQRLEAAEERTVAIRKALTNGTRLTIAEISKATSLPEYAVRAAVALMLFAGEIEERVRPRIGRGTSPRAYSIARGRAATSGRFDPLVRINSFRSDL